jgi:hypothetical protein
MEVIRKVEITTFSISKEARSAKRAHKRRKEYQAGLDDPEYDSRMY